MKNVQLLVIDPQYDFMDEKDAALAVPGANSDMNRLAAMVRRIGRKLDDIHVTLDSHRILDIAHPGLWKNQKGENPAPFTIISHDDVVNGIWLPRNPDARIPDLGNRTLREYAVDYTKFLQNEGKYQLMIWPPHCRIGTKGHNVQVNLAAALEAWEVEQFGAVDYVTKGSNPWTEHYGGLQAEYPLASDPTTSLNTALLDMLQVADIVAVAGEADSHCVKYTVDQIEANIGPDQIAKFVLLTDCMSPVPAATDAQGKVIVDFPAIAKQWQRDMEAKGMKLTTSVEFLA